MFVDASAIVAILVREPGHEALMDALRVGSPRLTGGLAVFEAMLAVARHGAVEPPVAESIVDRFLEAMGIVQIPLTAAETRAAIEAHARYGKGRHPARLNLGDCFAYACAKVHDVPLLFVGDDFTRTDIRSALV